MTYWLKNFAKKQKLTKLKVNVEGFETNPKGKNVGLSQTQMQKARVFIENQVIQEAEDISRPNRFFKFGRSIFCFVHPIFRFCFLVTFGDEVTKILCNLCLHFARQDEQDGKKTGKKITQLKWPKYQKPKDENMGWMKEKKE